MEIEFQKWHGASNDFLIAAASASSRNVILASLKNLAPALCAKDGTGIGADGIILVLEDNVTRQPAQIVVVNRDGSEAQNCGNGLRCVGGYLLRQRSTKGERPQEVILPFGGREILGQCLEQKSTHSYFLAINMGEPRLDAANAWHDRWLAFAKAQLVTKDLKVERLASAELGNRHGLVILPAQPQLALLRALGAKAAPWLNEQATNLHFVWPTTAPSASPWEIAYGESLQAFSWEAGVGETPSCGSGATAIGATILADGLSARSEAVRVVMPGGDLYVHQTEAGGEAVLTGPASYVFRGFVEI